jgi:hypothetical protein
LDDPAWVKPTKFQLQMAAGYAADQQVITDTLHYGFGLCLEVVTVEFFCAFGICCCGDIAMKGIARGRQILPVGYAPLVQLLRRGFLDSVVCFGRSVAQRAS